METPPEPLSSSLSNRVRVSSRRAARTAEEGGPLLDRRGARVRCLDAAAPAEPHVPVTDGQEQPRLPSSCLPERPALRGQAGAPR